MGLSIGQLTPRQLAFLRASKQDSRKGEREGSQKVFETCSQTCHAVTLAHLSAFYRLKANHLVQPTPKGRGSPKGPNARTWDSLETSLEAAHPGVCGHGPADALRSGFRLTPSHPHSLNSSPPQPWLAHGCAGRTCSGGGGLLFLLKQHCRFTL